MNTTMVFAELIVIGVEGMIVLAFLFLAFFDVAIVKNAMDFFKDWEPMIYFIFLSMLYVLGVLLDRLADSHFDADENKLIRQIIHDMEEDFIVIRYSLGKQNEYLNQQLEYTRTRIRIVRASALTFPMIAISAIIYIFNKHKSIAQTEYILMAVILGVGCAFYIIGRNLWESLQRSHLGLVNKMYNYEEKNGKDKKTRKPKKKALQ